MNLKLIKFFLMALAPLIWSEELLAQSQIKIEKFVTPLWERTITYTWMPSFELDDSVELPLLLLPGGETKVVPFHYEIIRDPAKLAGMGAPFAISDRYVATGDICATNLGNDYLTNIRIEDQVQEHVLNTENQWRDIEGAKEVIVTKESLAPGATLCFPYRIVFREFESEQEKSLETHAYRNIAILYGTYLNQRIQSIGFSLFGAPTSPVVVREVDESASYTFDILGCPEGMDDCSGRVIGVANESIAGDFDFFLRNNGIECGEEFELTGQINVRGSDTRNLTTSEAPFTVTTGLCQN